VVENGEIEAALKTGVYLHDDCYKKITAIVSIPGIKYNSYAITEH